MELLDSRRLTGPNLHDRAPGAIAELRFAGAREAEVAAPRLRAAIGYALEQLGWRDSRIHVREIVDAQGRPGAELMITAAFDQLYTATLINEWAIERGDGALDSSGLDSLREAADAERNLAARVLIEAADRRGVSWLFDDERLSLGYGARARSWAVDALPEPGAVDWEGRGPDLPIAVITGTNGKTTTAHLLASVLDAAGRDHLRLGTTGNWLVDREIQAGFTTPFPVELQGLLATAVRAGASDVVMEVSSHALDQKRVEPLRYQAVAMTSFSQDHLDYHPSMAQYLASKCLLAQRHLAPGGTVVVPVSLGEAGEAFVRAAGSVPEARILRCSREAAPQELAQIAVVEALRSPPTPGIGHALRVRTPAGPVALRSPLIGDFNLDNLLVTVGLALGLGIEIPAIERGLATSVGAPGRLERVEPPTGSEGSDAGPAVFVDYAHTPDAVARSIAALRASTRGRLIVVLGCGGDRDRQKRPQMGEAASRGADLFVATSDNPRTEDPDGIMDDMLAGVVEGANVEREVDRAKAIALAVAAAGPGDTVLIAGKGHEDYQVLGTTKIHFDDREQVLAALGG